MKTCILISLFVSFVFGSTVTPKSTSSNSVTAPVIYDKSNYPLAPVGSIVFDSKDNKFYGKGVGTNYWIEFSG